MTGDSLMSMTRPILGALLALAAVGPVPGQTAIEITLKAGSQPEAATKEQLLRLLKSYDVSKWTFTKSVVIDQTLIPHSHPVLTLSTRHLRDDELLLTTYIHEQLHWYFVSRGKDTQEAVNELQRVFPDAETQPPGGSNGPQSTYQHMLVCLFEYKAAQELLGELKARQVMEFWSHDHYTWVYRMVLERGRDIENVAAKFKLKPFAAGQ